MRQIKQWIRLLSAVVILACLSLTITAQEATDTPEAPPQGVVTRTDDAYEGYTLFAGLYTDETYLIDMDGNLLKQWAQDGSDGHETYLTDEGNLIYTTVVRTPLTPTLGVAGGFAGGIVQTNWAGEEVWSYQLANEEIHLHHDIEPLPNGNILAIAWEFYTVDEMLSAGMNPDNLPTEDELIEQGVDAADVDEYGALLWVDAIVEIDPTTDEIVWRWSVWDHLVQDYDESLPNYGDPAAHPERIDINYLGQRYLGDWQHANAIAYNPELDQIALSLRNFSEIWVIDHSTTTDEAATSEGGNTGMGGDLLYRWGNEAAYSQGTVEDQQLFRQHDVHWIEPGLPGEGNLLIYNNGDSFRDREYSSVIELETPLQDDGTYALDGETYAPDEPIWEWTATPPEAMFAPFVSSAQRLPNGNTLLVEGTAGHVREVTAAGEIVWEYISPYEGVSRRGAFAPNSIFRVRRYDFDHPAFGGRDDLLDTVSP